MATRKKYSEEFKLDAAYISPVAVDEVIRIQTMNKAKAECTELGQVSMLIAL